VGAGLQLRQRAADRGGLDVVVFSKDFAAAAALQCGLTDLQGLPLADDDPTWHLVVWRSLYPAEVAAIGEARVAAPAKRAEANQLRRGR
jgi:hypothetical protein